MVEHPAVNRKAAGSSPAVPARRRRRNNLIRVEETGTSFIRPADVVQRSSILPCQGRDAGSSPVVRSHFDNRRFWDVAQRSERRPYKPCHAGVRSSPSRIPAELAQWQRVCFVIRRLSVQVRYSALRIKLERFHDGLISHVHGFESHIRYGDVAQLARALPCHGRGHGFKPRRFHLPF